jgi:hypothetical protein
VKKLSRRQAKEELEVRRALVIRNMRELMKSMGRSDFERPDDWLDSIIARPRASAQEPRQA